MNLPFEHDDEFFRMASLALKPKYLYKYHNLNLHLMELLMNAKFYLASKVALNDPLDSAYTISLDNYLKLYSEKYPGIIDDKEHVKLVSSIFEWKTIYGEQDLLENIDEFQNKLRVCCFTENGDNPLMWSHYASNHTGVCLKFELEKDSNLEKSILPVFYQNELIDAKDTSDFRKCLLTKLKSWDIEREWRIISDKEKFEFKNEALVEIVFGLKVPESTIN